MRTRSTMLTTSGTLREVHAELVGGGCTEPKAPPKPGAPAGSPCTHHSVCGAVECACPGHGATYLARACVEGRCAEAPAVCAVA
ncbi:MAG TPA: hypothetical protein VKY73_04485, partial [Polyangiaceae bacterium]|nr:hypothetical protein [Polyangiaceae bacterium]